MPDAEKSALPALLSRHEKDILDDWVKLQVSADTHRGDLITERDVRDQSARFLAATRAAAAGGGTDIRRPEWSGGARPPRRALAEPRPPGLQPRRDGHLRASRSSSRCSPASAASWRRTRRPWPTRPGRPRRSSTSSGLLTMEVYQKGREEVIQRQQEELLELSTPVVKLWDSVLALPLIGTLDSARTQVVMENLLQEIVETGRRASPSSTSPACPPWTRWWRSTS